MGCPESKKKSSKHKLKKKKLRRFHPHKRFRCCKVIRARSCTSIKASKKQLQLLQSALTEWSAIVPLAMSGEQAAVEQQNEMMSTINEWIQRHCSNRSEHAIRSSIIELMLRQSNLFNTINVAMAVTMNVFIIMVGAAITRMETIETKINEIYVLVLNIKNQLDIIISEGVSGPQGPAGPPGAPGATGPQGPQGPPLVIGCNAVALGACSFAEGRNTLTTINAEASHVEGEGTLADGHGAHAEGGMTVANGEFSHAEGNQSVSNGNNSHAEGNSTSAIGNNSHAEGSNSTASADGAHAEGNNTTASGIGAHAEGNNTLASGGGAHAEGDTTTASGGNAHAEGARTTASGSNAHTEGADTVASNLNAHAEGGGAKATGSNSHAEGFNTQATMDAAHAEGSFTQATGNSSHAEGTGTVASGADGHAEGRGSQATGLASHAEGMNCQANGDFSHTEGEGTIANGFRGHAEGLGTQANGVNSHAQGNGTTAGGENSFSLGFNTQATGSESTAAGAFTLASGMRSHASGNGTIASGDNSVTFGAGTVADAINSFAGGSNTNTGGLTGAYIMGENGTARFPNSFHIANGLAVGPTLNSIVLDGPNGNVFLDGAVVSPTAADYAEMFETVSGEAIDAGYFVTLEGEKIRLATAEDQYVLGIISATPAMIGDACELQWQDMFLRDDFGRMLIDEQGQRMINPLYDGEMDYTPRRERPEWAVVGLLGKLIVHDDGSCMVNGYCWPNEDGIATASEAGYRVMKRISESLIRVLFK